ncbi:hypothetical protein BCR33DRAFT_372502 [Rhizoclosmatium globosum]|uniref:SP-RING-type domain-containing protein n=1 Tax=Rhizoclosmatium globosum TaxID=329046 RepID=A0A1Y2BZI5_9FUNG|nr:hypothetical protein BCR33DRAFT_372502 [Rhizoclosmatium globosum]|eukprot:ORY40203.1 hypothetical protein BCR33DRAFT_372502 [Rhizoclosmatium globosum]
MKRLTSEEIALKICEIELVSKGILSMCQKSCVPTFWTLPILSSEFNMDSVIKIGSNYQQLVQRTQLGHHSNNDNDIQHGNTVLTFICPLSLQRIKVPGRGKWCSHTQCFDIQNSTTTILIGSV